MADIFLSYASEDRDRIQPLVAVLNAEGWSVWWDRELVAGPSFDEKIEAELEAAGCVVVAWSQHSVRSRWCRAEASEGLERRLLVPLCLDYVRPPLVFRASQTASLVGWPEEQGDIDALLSGIRECLGDRKDRIESANVPIGSRKNVDRSVTVVRFTAAADDGSSSYASGLRDELQGLLTGYQELRSIVADTRGPEACYVINGSARYAGDRLRVRIGLVRTSNHQSVWSQSFDQETSKGTRDLSELAAIIGRTVRFQLANDHEFEAIKRTSKSSEAADCLCAALANNYRSNQGGDADFEFQLANARRAIELDPDLKESYWLLANYYVFARSRLSTAERTRLTQDVLRAGLAVAPDDPMIHMHVAYARLIFDLDYDGAEASLGKAISLEPSHPKVRWFHGLLGQTCLTRGDLTQAKDHYRRALSIFDSDARIFAEYARLLNIAGDPRGAIAAANLGLNLLDSGLFGSFLRFEIIRARVALGEGAAANALVDDELHSNGASWFSASMLVRTGRLQDAERLIAGIEKSNVPPGGYRHMAMSYTALRRRDRALDALRKAVELRDLYSMDTIRVEPSYAELREESGWRELIAFLEHEETEGRVRNSQTVGH